MTGSKGNSGNQNTVTEIKNTLDELISGLDVTKEGISELEDVAIIDTSKTEMQTEKRMYKTVFYPQEQGRISKRCNICVMAIPDREERKRYKYVM